MLDFDTLKRNEQIAASSSRTPSGSRCWKTQVAPKSFWRSRLQRRRQSKEGRLLDLEGSKVQRHEVSRKPRRMKSNRRDRQSAHRAHACLRNPLMKVIVGHVQRDESVDEGACDAPGSGAKPLQRSTWAVFSCWILGTLMMLGPTLLAVPNGTAALMQRRSGRLVAIGSHLGRHADHRDCASRLVHLWVQRHSRSDEVRIAWACSRLPPKIWHPRPTTASHVSSPATISPSSQEGLCDQSKAE